MFPCLASSGCRRLLRGASRIRINRVCSLGGVNALNGGPAAVLFTNLLRGAPRCRRRVATRHKPLSVSGGGRHERQRRQHQMVGISDSRCGRGLRGRRGRGWCLRGGGGRGVECGGRRRTLGEHEAAGGPLVQAVDGEELRRHQKSGGCQLAHCFPGGAQTTTQAKT
jgi:hypothetical protein